MKRLFLFIMCVFCFCVASNPVISQISPGIVNCGKYSVDKCPAGAFCELGEPYFGGTCGVKDGKCDCIPLNPFDPIDPKPAPSGGGGQPCTSDKDCFSGACIGGICVE